MLSTIRQPFGRMMVRKTFDLIPRNICRKLDILNQYSLYKMRKKSTMIKDSTVQSRVHLEIPKDSLYNFLMKRILDFGEKVSLVDGKTKESLTYNDIKNTVRSLGMSLLKNGFREGDVLGIMSPNNPQYAIVILAALGCKGTVSPVNHTYTEREMVNQLRDSNTKILVVSESNLSKSLKVADSIGLSKLIVLGNSNKKDECVLLWKEVISEDNKEFPFRVNVKENDIAFLPYSSGTTGKPKGVMLTHSNIISNILQYQYASRDIQCSSALGLLPFSHISGLVITLCYNLLQGNKLVTLPHFEADGFLKCISEYQIERLNLVPTLLQFLVDSKLIDAYDLSYVKDINTGAAPCGKDLLEAVETKFSNAVIRQGYGLTETSPFVLIQNSNKITVASSGVPAPNTEAKIVDINTGTTLGANATGELCIRGPQVMKGYLNMPFATNNCITEDKWLHTGDLAYYDENHEFFIVDRLKELIKYKGFPVSPSELEEVLRSHSKVIDVAVIGVPDKNGEVPQAHVIGKEGVTKEELLAFVGERVAPYKKLRGGIKFVKKIPRSQSGKILRRVLRGLKN